MKLPKFPFAGLLAACVSSVLSLSTLSAASYTWDGAGANTNFSTAENWSPDGAPVSASTTTLLFNISPVPGSYTPVADSAFTLNNMTFQSNVTGGSFWNLTGSAITFASNGATAPTLTVGANISAGTTVSNRIANDLVLDNNLTVFVGTGSYGAELSLNGIISGSGQLIKSSQLGTLRLNGANTFAGGVSMNRGNLILGNDAALGTGALTLAGNATSYSISSSGGTRTIANAISNLAGSGATTMTGTLVFNGNITLGSSTALTTQSRILSTADGANITYNGNIAAIDGATGAAQNLVMRSAGASGAQASTRTTINGTSSHTGTTTFGVSSGTNIYGTYFVNGNLTSSSGTTVYAGTVLRGTGSLAATTINAGAILAPGGTSASATTLGTMIIKNSVAIAGTGTTASTVATMRFNLGTLGTSDALSITDGAAVAGAPIVLGDFVTLTLVTSNLANLSGSYTLVSWDETVTPNSYGTFASITLGTTNSNGTALNWEESGYSIEYRANSIVLVPEPSTYALIAAAGLVLVVFRRRHLAGR